MSIEQPQQGTMIEIINNIPMPCSLFIYNSNNNDVSVIHCNQALATLLRLNMPDDFKHEFDQLALPFQPDGTSSYVKLRQLIAECIETGQPITFDWLYYTTRKEYVQTSITLQRVALDDGFGIMAYMQDISETRQMRESERIAKLRFQAMLDSCPLACAIVDKQFNVIDCNQEVVNLFELLDKTVFRERFFELSPEYQPDGQLSHRKVTDKLKQTFEAGRICYEWQHKSMNGELIPCEVVLVHVNINEIDMAIMYIHDLREIKRSLEMVKKMESIAYTDELTRLFSRRYFMENADSTFALCKENLSPFHLIMMDLDHFKAVNDTYGHLIGDEVLKIAAARMGNVTRKGTVIARYGGEEFIVMLTDLSYDAAVKTAQRIQKVMEQSRFMIKGLSIGITVSLGVATLENQEQSLYDIINMADVACYTAKRTGRNKVVEYRDVPTPTEDTEV